METGQYRTKRLIVTKSYIAHRSRRIEMSQIAEATQPKNNPAAIVTSLVLMAGTFILFSNSSLNLWLLGFFGLMLIGGLLPPPVVNLTLVNGTTHRINLSKERRPQRAIRTITANIQEYQSKAGRARSYTLPVTTSNSSLNPEEHVRQYVLQLLTLKFGYAKSDIGYEFPIKLGSSQKRADVVIFLPGAPHTQANVYIIVECKRADRRDDAAAQDQLESYLSACLNARYGVVATHRWRVTEKFNTGTTLAYRQIAALVDGYGTSRQIDYRPGQPVVHEIEEETEEFLDDLVLDEPESRIPQILSGNLKYAMAVGIVCAGVFWVSNAIRPSEISVPTVAAPHFPTFTLVNGQAFNPGIVSSPISAMTALPFRTFTPSVNEQAINSTNPPPSPVLSAVTVVPVEPSATITATLTPLPLSVTLVPTALLLTTAPTNSSFGVIETNLNVNVRQTPSTHAVVIAVLQPGTRIEILGANEDDSWLNIRLSDGKQGWVASRLVRME